MLLNNITLRNFRNYVDCQVSFSEPVNLIIGGNAQGKTSLLEAIYFLCTAESHRATRDAELIRHNEPGFYLKGVLTNCSDDVVSLEASKRARGEFRLKKNGVLHTKRSEWIGQFNAVFFAPESLRLVKGAPAERRRFLDLLIAQIDRNYLQHLQKYQHVLKQRNELLKQIRLTFADAMQLNPWDKLLLTHGTAITLKRLEVFRRLKNYTVNNHQRLTGGQESLALTYRSASIRQETSMEDINDLSESEANSFAESAGGAFGGTSENQITQQFSEILNASRPADLQRGTTLVGPHRDDFLIELESQLCTFLKEKEETGTYREGARTYGSQGQQRTIALALKLSELELIRATTGRNPIVLLDDVTSELDNKRVGYLLSVLQNLSAQTFITATYAEPLVHHLHDPHVFTVKNARIQPDTCEKKQK